MEERSSRSLTLLLGGVAVVALGVLGFRLFQTERRMTRLEEQLAKGSVVTTTAPGSRPTERPEEPSVKRSATMADAVAAAAVRHAKRRSDGVQGPAQPKMPEARRFAEENDLDERQWRTLTRLNEYWMESLKKAAAEGEASLPDSLEYIAKQREIKLQSVLGADDGVSRYREFESSLRDHRLSYKSKDGTDYGAVPFE